MTTTTTTAPSTAVVTPTRTTVAGAGPVVAVGAPRRFADGGGGRPRPVVFRPDIVAGDATNAGMPATRAFGATVQDLLRQRDDLPAGHPDRAALRLRAIEAGLPLARRLAIRYRGRGEPLDDLYQVAALALVKAVDGYDPARQAAFTSYAVPTVVGALKRHFRDSTWRVRVPRRIQELALDLARAGALLAQRLGRSPTLRELAVHLDATEQEVAVALNAWLAHHPDSLDALSPSGGENRRPLVDTLGIVDTRFDAVTDRHTLQPLLTGLTVLQQRMLAMRFFDDLTQTEIAAQLGVSQMQISRLLVATLTQLRAGMLAEPSAVTPRGHRVAGQPPLT
jgi:RNA polymerase sigma-B factor